MTAFYWFIIMSHTFRQQPTVSRNFPVLDSRFSPNYDPIISFTKTIILSFNKFSLEIEIMSSQKMPHNPVPKVVAFRSFADFFTCVGSLILYWWRHWPAGMTSSVEWFSKFYAKWTRSLSILISIIPCERSEKKRTHIFYWKCKK